MRFIRKSIIPKMRIAAMMHSLRQFRVVFALIIN